MKLRTFSLLCAASLAVAFGPGEAKAQSPVGRWTGTPSPGVTMDFEFRDDGTGTWDLAIRGNAASSGSYEFEYRVDATQTPMTIDLIAFDREPLLGRGLFGIFRFQGRDVIYLDFQEGPVDPARLPVRPVEFTTSTQRLERVDPDR